MANPLIAAEQDSTTAVSGIGIAESAVDLASGIESGNWVEIGFGAAGVGLEALSIAMDPAGALLSAGVGWLMEHVEPLSEILDRLAGDADAVAAHAATWRNVAQAVGDVAADYGPAVAADTAGWTGAAADAYRTRGTDLANLLSAASTASGGVGTAVEMAGMIVGVVREIVRDLIADLVGRLIAWALEVAATLGLATPVVVAQATSAIAKWAARIADVVQKLIRTMNNLIPLLRRLDEVFASIRQAVDSFASGARRADLPTSPTTPGSPTMPDTPGPPNGTTPAAGPATTSPSSASSPSTADPASPTAPDQPDPTAAPTPDQGPPLFSRQGDRTNAEVLASGDHLPMTPDTIREFAHRAGVDLEGIDVNIANTPDDVRYYDSMRASASTGVSPDGRININLAPSAFADEEGLMRNLVHERVHVDQYRDGRVGTGNTQELEDEAYRADEEFWRRYSSGGGR
jgi:hypothetical protein